MKFKKTKTKQKNRIIGKVKNSFKNLSDDQKLLQFNFAWNGIAPKDAKGFLGKIGSAASKKAPGIIYQQIKDDINAWINSFKTKQLDVKLAKRIRKNLLKKAYDFSGYSKTVKHLTPEQITQYKEFSSMIETILSINEANLFRDKDLKWIKETLLKDIKKSEDAEKLKMMKDFGIL